MTRGPISVVTTTSIWPFVSLRQLASDRQETFSTFTSAIRAGPESNIVIVRATSARAHARERT